MEANNKRETRGRKARPILTGELSDEAIRVNLAYFEFEKSIKGPGPRGYSAFANKLEMPLVTIYSQLTGKRPISKKTRDAVCSKLGYAEEFMTNGTGPKKAKKTGIKDGKTLITEIQELRTTVNLLRQEIHRMEQRNRASDNDIAELKKQLDNLLKTV